MPKCPYCQHAVSFDDAENDPAPDARPVKASVRGRLNKEIMYSCPHCRSILGFGSFVAGPFSRALK